jgi:hypothetical protein
MEASTVMVLGKMGRASTEDYLMAFLAISE